MRGRRELGLVGNNNWYRSIGFGGARRRWRSSRAAAEHGDAGRAESAAAAADLRGGAEAAVARRGSAEGRPSSGTRRIGRVGRVGARSWRGLVACGAWQNKPRRRAHRVGRVYGCAPDVAGTSGPRVCTTSRRWTWCADRVLTRRERGPGARGRGVCAAKGTAARWQAWQRRWGGGGYNDVDGEVERALRADSSVEDVGLL